MSVGGAGYADIYKMLTDHPHDYVLRNTIRSAFSDEKISSREYRQSLETYFGNHGAFTAVPVIVNSEEKVEYPESKYKYLIESHFTFSDDAICENSKLGVTYPIKVSENQKMYDGNSWNITTLDGTIIAVENSQERDWVCFDEKGNRKWLQTAPSFGS